MSHLAAIEGYERRQFYVRHVQQLDLDSFKCEIWRNCTLKALQCGVPSIEVYLNDNRYSSLSGPVEKWPVGQYIQPSIESIEPADDILYLLETRCPRLERVYCEFSFQGVTSRRGLTSSRMFDFS